MILFGFEVINSIKFYEKVFSAINDSTINARVHK